MYCSSCGKQMDHVRMRCPECHHMTSAYWLNAYSLALWLLIVAANYFYLQYLIPVWKSLMIGLGEDLPLGIKLHLALADLVSKYGLLILVLFILLLGFLHWKKKSLPGFLKSGRLLASLTWVVAVITLGGILAGMTSAVIWAPKISELMNAWRESARETLALEGVRDLVAAEAAFRQKNPRLGYTCKLEELKPFLPRRSNLLLSGFKELDLTKMEAWKEGYEVSLQGCSGTPSTAYRIVASPTAPWEGWKGRTFCADGTAIKFFVGPELDRCLKDGRQVY